MTVLYYNVVHDCIELDGFKCFFKCFVPSIASSVYNYSTRTLYNARHSDVSQLELYSCLESVLGSLTWEGAPTLRGVVVSRDVERHFGVRVEAARQVPRVNINVNVIDHMP